MKLNLDESEPREEICNIAHLEINPSQVSNVFLDADSRTTQIYNFESVFTLVPGAHLPDLLSKSRAVPGSADICIRIKFQVNAVFII